LVELDWSLCAWCGKDFERPETIAAAYIPGARRPALEAQTMPMHMDGPMVPGYPMGAPEMAGFQER
jgi:hypothetical protein